MKRLLLLFIIMIGHLAHAEKYSYLTFEIVDGTKVSVEAQSLTLTISGATLTIEGKTFTLSNLIKMYFTDSDMTTNTGINFITDKDWTDAVEVYDLKGQKVVKNQLSKGVYVIKSSNGTCKLAVKK